MPVIITITFNPAKARLGQVKVWMPVLAIIYIRAAAFFRRLNMA